MESAVAMSIDAQGFIYVAGKSTSPDFGSAAGMAPLIDSNFDVFVAKLSPSGSELLYAVRIGGTGDDRALDIDVDDAGDVYIAGRTNSVDWPTTKGAYDVVANGKYDGFLAKLAADGSTLLFSTYLGGASDDRALAVMVGSDRTPYVFGRTHSNYFPVTAGTYDSTFNGESDAFVSRFAADGTTLLFSSLLGGSGSDRITDRRLGPAGQIYVAGSTTSADFPTTASALDPFLNGASDVFVAKFDSAATSLLFSSYLGGSGIDGALSLAVGGSGQVYVSGETTSPDFPVTSGSYDRTYGGGVDGFVVKVETDPSRLAFGTFLGGSGTDRITAVALRQARAHAVAETDSPEFSGSGGTHALAVSLSATGSRLRCSTLLAGMGDDHPFSAAVDAAGGLYVTGKTNSTDFPTTPGSYDTTQNGGFDVFVTKLSRCRE